MKAESLPEHEWLQKLVGQWSFESECSMGPDQPDIKSTGAESVRSLGGIWTLGEGTGEMPDGGVMTSIMTLGYDPTTKRFIGTFVASVMTHLWIYKGTLDATKKILTLDTEGPDFSGGPGLVKYQDVITFLDDNHRTLTSGLIDGDGKFNQFMSAHYRRT